MGYVPKFIHFDKFIPIRYPIGVHWKHEYIKQGAKAIYDTFQEDLSQGVSITFVVRGTSGAMIAGALLNEIHHIDPNVETYILIVRKETDTEAHCSSLYGIDKIGATRFIIADDFISSGDTVHAIIEALDRYLGEIDHRYKYDALLVSSAIESSALKKNKCSDYEMWKGICRRFRYVICCPKPKKVKEGTDDGSG